MTNCSTHLADLQRELYRVVVPLVFHEGPPPALADLSIAQLRCFHGIARHEGSKMHELGERLHVKLPALSHLVDRLVRRGLVERRPDKRDRRVVRLHLTPVARDIHLEGERARQATLAAALDSLEPGCIEKVIQSLSALADAAERAAAGESRDQPLSQDPLVELTGKRGQAACAGADSGVSPKPQTGRQIRMSP